MKSLRDELSCVIGTAEPYEAPSAPTRGIYDYEPSVDFSRAKLSCWSSNKKYQGKGIKIVHHDRENDRG